MLSFDDKEEPHVLLKKLRTESRTKKGDSITQADIENAIEGIVRRTNPNAKKVPIGSGHYSRYETGKAKPTLEKLALIFDALGELIGEPLPFIKRREVIARFGLKVVYELPTQHERDQIKEAYKANLDALEYPSYILDNKLRIVHVNNAFLAVSGISKGSEEYEILHEIPTFALLYHEKIRLVDNIHNKEEYIPITTAVLSEEFKRQGEPPWYLEEIQKQSAIYPEFREALEVVRELKPVPMQSAIPLSAIIATGEIVKYTIVLEPIIPDDRFMIIRYLPA